MKLYGVSQSQSCHDVVRVPHFLIPSGYDGSRKQYKETGNFSFFPLKKRNGRTGRVLSLVAQFRGCSLTGQATMIRGIAQADRREQSTYLNLKQQQRYKVSGQINNHDVECTKVSHDNNHQRFRTNNGGEYNSVS